MKKLLILLLSVILGISLIFIGTGCKTAATTETTLAVETTAVETTAAVTTAAETTSPGITGKIKVALGGWPKEDMVDPGTRKKMKGYNVILDEFKALYPNIEVEIIDIGGGDMATKSVAMLTAGSVDVVDMFQYPAFAEDLTPYVERDAAELKDLAVTNTIDYIGWDKLQITALPSKAKVHAIYYDKQLFDEWGVEYLQSPTTWNEILEKAQKMTGTNPVSGKQNYGFWKAYSFAIEDVIQNYSSRVTDKNIVFDQTGEGFYDVKINFSTDQNWIDALKYYKEIFKYTDPGAKEYVGYDKFGTQENDLAIIQISWTDGMISQAEVGGTAGDLTKVNRIGFVDMPRNPDGKFATYFSGSLGMGMAKTSENKEAAWAWIKWVATSPTVSEYLYNNQGRIPVNYKGLELTQFAEKYPDIAEIMKVQPVDYLLTYKPIAGTEAIIDKYCNLYWTDSMTLEAALAAMEKESQEVADSAKAAQ